MTRLPLLFPLLPRQFHRSLQNILIMLFCAGLAACGTQKPATQTSASGLPTVTGQYRVARGDTLSKIARQHGQSVQSLMSMNGISNPNHIRVGQILRVQGGAPMAASEVSPPAVSTKSIAAPRSIALVWPAQGQSQRGTTTSSAQGVIIRGQAGSPIKAAASGKVVYSGSGLRGYGNMLIINHDANFLSVYAHNDRLIAKEGAQVKQGETIATMGSTGTQTVQLYFELRYNGKAVDALRYLPK